MDDKQILDSDETITWRFFKDLNTAERVKVLKVFGIIPADYSDFIQQPIMNKLFGKILERRGIDQAIASASQPENVQAIINQTRREDADFCESWAVIASYHGFTGDAENYRTIRDEILALIPKDQAL